MSTLKVEFFAVLVFVIFAKFSQIREINPPKNIILKILQNKSGEILQIKSFAKKILAKFLDPKKYFFSEKTVFIFFKICYSQKFAIRKNFSFDHM